MIERLVRETTDNKLMKQHRYFHGKYFLSCEPKLSVYCL